MTQTLHRAKAYRARARAYATWLSQYAGEHPDALVDQVGAEAAVTAWRRHLITTKASPSTVNQALAAVDLLYEVGAGLRLKVKRARVPRPGEPDALTPKEPGMVKRAADCRGVRDAAIVAVLLYTGARADGVRSSRPRPYRPHRHGPPARQGRRNPPRARPGTRPQAAHRLDPPPRQRAGPAVDRPAWSAHHLGHHPDHARCRRRRWRAWPATHRLRHTYATRLRQGGAGPAQVQALLGHASLDTTARYFWPGTAEQAAVVERIFQ